MWISHPRMGNGTNCRQFVRAGVSLALAGVIGWSHPTTTFAQQEEKQLTGENEAPSDNEQEEAPGRTSEAPGEQDPSGQLSETKPEPDDTAKEGEGEQGTAKPSTPTASLTVAPPKDDMEEMTVTGSRAITRTSIQEKRSFDSIVDALAAEDIGDIPALSIGEAIETLPGASSHREQGGATEISIRGMGPYLGSTVINGREATNGSGDRSVNFSQFPSELFDKIKIFKSQEARLIEGGVSGQIHLDTIKPIEFGKPRFQLALKGEYHPNNSNIDNNARDIGSRVTLSYVDQFEAEHLGRMGVSLGLQKRLSINPEQEYRTTSGWRLCGANPTDRTGLFRGVAGNCDSAGEVPDLTADPTTGLSTVAQDGFLFVPSSRSYRQNITDDDRESLFAAFQWQPTDSVDINFDVQVSNRTFTEDRNDLLFAEQRRITPGLTAATIQLAPTGEVSLFENEARIETISYFQERIERYRGGGLNLAFDFTKQLRLTVDTSYSATERQENILQTRLQSANTDIFGAPTSGDRVFTSIANPGPGSLVPLVAVQDFDVTNPDLFSNLARTRVDLNQRIENRIRAVRADVEYEPERSFLSRLSGGVRLSELEFTSFPRARDTYEGFDQATTAAANLACRRDRFPERDFLSGPSGGQDLITQLDENRNVVSSGSAYASFDARCLARELIGNLPEIPEPRPSVANIDVTERSLAGYMQADFFGVLGGIPTGGNVGVRVVNTNVDSTGLRTTFTTTRGADGTLIAEEDAESFTTVTGGSGYTEFLPSANVVLDLTDTVAARVAGYRALSRPDPSAMGFGRQLAFDNNENILNAAEFVGTAQALGNPSLLPLTSWNADIALEWYPDQDSILAGVFYFKRFQGGFENSQAVETFVIDGTPVQGNVTIQQTDPDTNNLFGVELSGAHAFTYLPSFLSGFGAKLNLNFSVSDFEFEDQNFGDALVFNDDGTVGNRVGIVEPGNLFGFSSLVGTGQLYYGIGGLDVQFIIKHRSEYFHQFTSTPGNLRFVGDNTVFEARVTYKFTRNFTVRAEAINFTDEPRRQFNPTRNNLAEINSYGPRLFLGLRAKF